jgi:DNA-binding response OmpR family regulator
LAVILIADDDTLIRTMMQKLLTRAGHTIFEAANGIEAEAVAAEHAIDLLITDIVMPDKEGLMLVRDLKERQPQLKIIAMSGGGRSGAFTVLDAATQFGADAVLRKPFRGRELIETVIAVIGGSRDILPPAPLF